VAAGPGQGSLPAHQDLSPRLPDNGRGREHYACEILFAAGIHPATPAGALTTDDWGRILRETRRILRAAIRQGGTTVSNFLNSQGEAGLFQVRLLVYGKKGEPCPGCGAPIVRLKQAGRSSFCCPACQKLLA